MKANRVRRYDAERGCYVYDIGFSNLPEQTPRTMKVGEAFGLGLDTHRHQLYDDFELRLTPGDVVYITGDSGSGKSLLLEAIRADLGEEAVVMSELPEPSDVALVDALGDSFTEALELLSRVGLNDAHLFLRHYNELSAGQRYRFRLAQMIDSGKLFWLCDEFCSLLDRDTARVVTYNMQKHARRLGASLIVATSHTDLVHDLCPDTRIVKGWGDQVLINYDNPVPARCTVADEVVIEEGERSDYDKLEHLHYRGGGLAFPHGFYRMTHNGEVVGVIVYKSCIVHTQGREDAVGYRPDVDELNRDWTLITRVIVHPKYRGIGLGSQLIKETLKMQPRRHVELIAVMALYSPFAERAGMKLIRKTEPQKHVYSAVEALHRLGFDPSRLSSKSYNREKIQALDSLDELYEAFAFVKGSLYYRRITGSRELYTIREYIDWVHTQDLDSLAKAIQNLSVLTQSKAYLYWSRDA